MRVPLPGDAPPHSLCATCLTDSTRLETVPMRWGRQFGPAAPAERSCSGPQLRLVWQPHPSLLRERSTNQVRPLLLRWFFDAENSPSSLYSGYVPSLLFLPA